jgi:hypothetical protein
VWLLRSFGFYLGATPRPPSRPCAPPLAATAFSFFFSEEVMLSVPYEFVCELAREFGAVEVCWRESERSFTGFVAEVWFDAVPREFAVRWSRVVGYSVLVRSVSSGPARFAVSVPCVVAGGSVRLGWASRGSRVRLVR